MNKAAKDKIVTAVLLVVLVTAIMYSKNKTGRSISAAVKTSAAMDIEKVKERLNAFSAGTQQKTVDKDARDIFKMPVISQSAVSAQGAVKVKRDDTQTLVLEGVIWNGKQNLAIISGQVVSEGEYVGDAKVQSITEKGAVLLRDGSKVELTRLR